ncbi:MAG: ATP-binding cassette domain-containing protein, partial [Candidatus Pacearchaeota archaeon]|nr:ATP-binding cassette domain-containing protein [Candidatus Pacearchaeota archaeon]
KANVHEFLEELEDGYNTLAGENGVRFSIGQKQRICLARAIVKDAWLLLLDEPTSSLDSHSEALFQKSLSDYKHTILIVSHRLSIIENAHNIIVLDNGKIVETGTHHELLEKQGTYYNLYSTQFIHAKESEC